MSVLAQTSADEVELHDRILIGQPTTDDLVQSIDTPETGQSQSVLTP